MKVVLNGRDADVAADATVASVLAALDVPAEARGVAVAVDAEVVPRGAWGERRLREGARVEVLHAVQGG
ncbi:MAG TPA: sulfur carrier protein ThiS [Solirubrobacteraceae bacterium]|jgi:sulfur carrier protein